MTKRREFLLSSLWAGIVAGFPGLASTASRGMRYETALQRIAFGSCCKSWKPQTIWKNILRQSPDMFLFLGDSIYADDEEIARYGIVRAFEKAYRQLAGREEFQRFRRKVRIEATWDDHDYGPRESGADFQGKEISRQQFLDFWQVPQNDQRRYQQGGIYAASEHGPADRRVQVILLDTRYGRSALLELSNAEFNKVRQQGFGPYLPNEDVKARLLDDSQWQWLGKQLLRPAAVRLICSSVPFSAGFRGWESWANFPLERRRLINLIGETKANGVIFLSGDVHYGELSCERNEVPYPLWDLTSSGLTHYWPTPGPNSNRVYPATVNERNFGLVNISWKSDKTDVALTIHDAKGRQKLHHSLRLSSLSVN